MECFITLGRIWSARKSAVVHNIYSVSACGRFISPIRSNVMRHLMRLGRAQYLCVCVCCETLIKSKMPAALSICSAHETV